MQVLYTEKGPFRYACINEKMLIHKQYFFEIAIIVNEYDQEISLSQTADNPLAPRGTAPQPSRDTRKTN